MTLHIARNFNLPEEAITQTFAILGIRGSGKTNTGVVLAEELLKRKHQIVVIDPVDVWWGLKSSEDGKAAGFPIPVIGGDHADVPLESTAGQVLADFVTDTQASVILALRHLSMNDQRRFAGDFARRLYERKGHQRSPLMVFVDEADEFVPQRLPHGHEAMFGAFDRLVRRGRTSGIGVTLISQRAQVINKDVLSQCEVLVGMRVLHRLDRKALEAWIEAHDTEGKGLEFINSLASLGLGDAWIWSPSWLNVFQRVHIRARETYDSSATPKAGAAVAAPKQVAAVDLDRLKLEMAATIERAKADDPRELRRRITELEKQLKSHKTPAADPTAIEAAREKGRQQGRAEVRRQMAGVSSCRHELVKAIQIVTRSAEFMQGLLDIPMEVQEDAPAPRPPVQPAPTARPSREPRAIASSDSSLAGGERKILTALAQYPHGRTKTQLALLTGYAHSGGGFNNYLSALRTRGLIEGSSDYRITQAGIDALGPFTPLPRGRELQDYWRSKVGKAERAILDVLIEAGIPLLKAEVASLAGYEVSGGGFNNALSRLRTLELISGSAELRASEELF